MRLQADPTVIYALMRKANDFDMDIRRVLYADLKIRSPYNTYRNGAFVYSFKHMRTYFFYLVQKMGGQQDLGIEGMLLTMYDSK